MKRFLAALILTLSILDPASGDAGVTLVGDTCQKVFDNPKADVISCQTGFRLDQSTQGTLATNSLGLLSELSCSAQINAKRSEVISKVHAGGDVALPQQEVECRIVSGGDSIRVRFHLAPVVRIDQGRAVDARLGIRDLTGIPEPLATAIAELLNGEPTLRKSLVAAANEIIPNLPKK
jgi:hypothetical protein